MTRYAGKERDPGGTDVGAGQTGLDYFGVRYYSSNMGRFLSPDWSDRPEAVPYADLTNPQSLNLYGYVGNNPLSRVDTDGHDGFKDFLNGLANATYRPAITAIQHPFVTGQALGNAFIHPVATAEAFHSSVVTTSQQVLNGNPTAIGTAVGTVGMAFIPGLGEAGEAAEGAAALIPSTVSRAIPASIDATTLGVSSASDVFVTSGGALNGMTSSEISNALTISSSPSGFNVYEFPTPEGIASPINRTNPGFVGGGKTANGLPEYVIPNGPIPANATKTHVPRSE